MPFVTDATKLDSPFLDRRCKLLPCQKEMIHWWYAHGVGIRALARMFHVDKRLIQFELFPERKKKNIEDRRDRGGSAVYYNKERSTKAIRDHRRYKYDILAHVTEGAKPKLRTKGPFYKGKSLI